MKANEFRIGNWVKRDTQPEGFQIDAQSFFTCEKHPDWYEPIPLTEEWLLKFGFVKGDNISCNDYFYRKVIDRNELTINPDNGICIWGETIRDNEVSTVLIKYVHQLQNLYFALTGNELEIK